MKKINSLILIMLLLTSSLSGCKNSENNLKNQDASSLTEITESNVTTEEIDINSMDLEFTDNDLKSNYDSNEIIETENDQDIININSDGVYKITGNHSQVIVDAPNTAKPHIILENANITSNNGPAIYIKNADKVFLSVAQNSENIIADSENYDTSYDNADGTIFSKSDLTINGKGKLTINGNYKCGIVSKDDLVVYETEIIIKSVGAAIEGKDCVKIKKASITTKECTDAIKSTNEEDGSRGFVLIESGQYNLTTQNDGIQAQTALFINGGTFNITSGGGSAVSSSNYGENGNNWGMWGHGFENQTSSSSSTESAKAIKSGNLIKITNGEFKIDSSDDAIHSNSDAEINGGTFEITSGDDGIHADDQLIINTGTIKITKSYEGIEATAITVSNGNIDVTASDDGFNAAGGNDSSAMGGRPGQNTFESNSDAKINIGGGYILVNASGDGIDSNGDITMSGGTLLVSGPENGGNGSLDYGGNAVINGGSAVIVGSSGMATTFSSSSEQPSFMYDLDNSQNSGTSLSVTSGSKVIASFIPSKQYSNIIISSPEFEVGKTYTVNIGGTVSNCDSNGFTQNGSIKNAQSSFEIELTSVSTSNGNQNGMGGGMQMQPGGGRPDGGKGGGMRW